MTDEMKKLIDKINEDRKNEFELLEFKKKQEETVKYMKVIYESYIQ